MGADFVGKFKDHRTKEMKLLLICIKSMIKLGAYKLCFFFLTLKHLSNWVMRSDFDFLTLQNSSHSNFNNKNV